MNNLLKIAFISMLAFILSSLQVGKGVSLAINPGVNIERCIHYCEVANKDYGYQLGFLSKGVNQVRIKFNIRLKALQIDQYCIVANSICFGNQSLKSDINTQYFTLYAQWVAEKVLKMHALRGPPCAYYA